MIVLDNYSCNYFHHILDSILAVSDDDLITIAGIPDKTIDEHHVLLLKLYTCTIRDKCML